MIHNREAEQAVLGTILFEGSLIKDIFLRAEHFASPDHQTLFQAIKKVYESDQPITIVSVTTELGELVGKVGGVSYLLSLADSVPTTTMIKHDQRMVLDAYRNRKTREVALRYAEKPCDEALDELMVQLEDLRSVGMEQSLPSTYDHLIEIANDMTDPPKNGQTGFSTGYIELDQMTGGTQRGDLIIVAARPSMGKTAFALNMAAHHCKNGGAVQLFSLEMGTKSLLKRIISMEAEVDGQKWQTMIFSDENYEQAMTAIGEIACWSLNIYEQERTVHDIRAKIRQSMQEDKERDHMVIIDYLQLMTAKGRYERRDLEVGAMTRELKLLARELDVPIILLSQLSRGVEQRQDKRPIMSDLRESGNIEQDADVIGFLYRDDYYNKDSEDRGRVEILLSKQRNGPVGSVSLRFLKEYGKFVGGGGEGLSIDHYHTGQLQSNAK
ncbi:replicative DNA helicase [Halobacillus shinanisalinarum]|uniref:Replicative DNA helicase n=1 Tax=Halobacillus shinanisalinarum TaxID=2932258 RepID=A0ABY4H701_9BACI|nr:replicative DNA helicase [Halobacillus shinanisalinarum]UOQ94762.1 replicative DNA helicase [Halobacillus shinanisalinarum]